jgi:hypothetical protein
MEPADTLALRTFGVLTILCVEMPPQPLKAGFICGELALEVATAIPMGLFFAGAAGHNPTLPANLPTVKG